MTWNETLNARGNKFLTIYIEQKATRRRKKIQKNDFCLAGWFTWSLMGFLSKYRNALSTFFRCRNFCCFFLLMIDAILMFRSLLYEGHRHRTQSQQQTECRRKRNFYLVWIRNRNYSIPFYSRRDILNVSSIHRWSIVKIFFVGVPAIHLQ